MLYHRNVKINFILNSLRLKRDVMLCGSHLDVCIINFILQVLFLFNFKVNKCGNKAELY